ncbi:hypothetical protein Aab01nite_73920 [Paractinoplanes abujensis]|nr:hypothetical protein Aab01nite_73920 [Actinoplanes abujensis]
MSVLGRHGPEPGGFQGDGQQVADVGVVLGDEDQIGGHDPPIGAAGVRARKITVAGGLRIRRARKGLGNADRSG